MLNKAPHLIIGQVSMPFPKLQHRRITKPKSKYHILAGQNVARLIASFRDPQLSLFFILNRLAESDPSRRISYSLHPSLSSAQPPKKDKSFPKIRVNISSRKCVVAHDLRCSCTHTYASLGGDDHDIPFTLPHNHEQHPQSLTNNSSVQVPCVDKTLTIHARGKGGGSIPFRPEKQRTKAKRQKERQSWIATSVSCAIFSSISPRHILDVWPSWGWSYMALAPP